MRWTYAVRAAIVSGMNPRLPVTLRHKYGLVHVPAAQRCQSWVIAVQRLLDEGLPPEHAGLQAAHAIFPYEAREVVRPDAHSVPEILADMVD